MLGFAIVDRQPTADTTAVWLTSRTDTTIVRNTNAVVIPHDDPDHDSKVQWLVKGRSVVLTEGTTPQPCFENAVEVDFFADLVKLTTAYQERICQAVDDYSRRQRSKLVCRFSSRFHSLRPQRRTSPDFTRWQSPTTSEMSGRLGYSPKSSGSAERSTREPGKHRGSCRKT
ncbi:hypothetical protein [Nocardia aobensis]|uniref:hypothetical protein n=1 Tax=Nocardia aobensis TaxID=257277 RepID=UPI00030E633C|nr:hypothetical protein [Nocardia aobensis]